MLLAHKSRCGKGGSLLLSAHVISRILDKLDGLRYAFSLRALGGEVGSCLLGYTNRDWVYS